MSIHFGMLLNGLAEKVNGTFIIKYVKNITEVKDTMLQLHIGLATTVINSNFLKKSDFSQIVFSNKLVIVVKKGEAVSQVKILFIIFKLEVWIMIIISIGITSFALWFILSMQEKRFSATKFGEIWLNVYLATIWGYFAPVLKNTKAQYICICYLIYQIHIQTGFTSNLVTVLTTPQHQPGITNLEELVESKLPVLAPIIMKYVYFSDIGEPNSIYSKIKNQMRFIEINLPQKEVAELLNYRNCTMLLMDLEVEDLKFVVGGDLHVNVIRADAVTGNVHAVFVMAPGHFFIETLNSFIRSIDESAYENANLDKCVSKTINQILDESEILAFIYDEYVNVELPKIMDNQYVIARCTGLTSFKLERSATYVIHLQTQELLNSTIQFLHLSSFWIDKQSPNGKYLVIIDNQNSLDLQKIFQFFWDLKIHKVTILTRHNSNNQTSVELHRSNPFSKENVCGAYVNKIHSQDCNNNVSINFSKIYKHLNGCKILFLVSGEPQPNLVYTYVFNIFNELAITVNRKFETKYSINLTELYRIQKQPVIPVSFGFQLLLGYKLFDFSNTVFIHKLLVAVKGGETISAVKVLFMIFKQEVWIMIVVSIFFTSLALWFISSLNKKQFRISKFEDTWFNVFLATIWGYFATIPKNIKIRYICICYLVYQLHIQTGFTSNLVTVLTSPQYNPGITNLEQLVESNLSVIDASAINVIFLDLGEPGSIYFKLKHQMRYEDLTYGELTS
ncbi:hypothetical protein RN001_011410 [Aquatica leii]|uniref:Ionotropic glutamate receptor C-terminal domain-containing protein n=1 Tax=Aquatica leii TaxID=1421715 RepID=A0AAN7P431_9COLE|nr:hypothetical protein RN001_011410 [Aquatica leii]